MSRFRWASFRLGHRLPGGFSGSISIGGGRSIPDKKEDRADREARHLFEALGIAAIVGWIIEQTSAAALIGLGTFSVVLVIGLLLVG
jgi:hypothetical protein